MSNYARTSPRDARDFMESVGEDPTPVGTEIYESIVNEIEQPYENFVDIYKFFDIFYDLLDDLNLLNKDSQEPDKITFIEEYPNQEYKEETFVVYGIGERDFFSNKSISEGSNVRQVKPLQLQEKYDSIQNNIKTDFAYKFDNSVEFQVFSTSLKKVQQTCKLLEGLIFKYRGRLKLYVDSVQYAGQTGIEYNPKYFERRLFSKSIKLQVITIETYSLVSEEIKYTN